MINDIFKLFGEQAADILFEIITECMDDYLYIFDLQNNTFEISQSAGVHNLKCKRTLHGRTGGYAHD